MSVFTKTSMNKQSKRDQLYCEMKLKQLGPRHQFLFLSETHMSSNPTMISIYIV